MRFHGLGTRRSGLDDAAKIGYRSVFESLPVRADAKPEHRGERTGAPRKNLEILASGRFAVALLFENDTDVEVGVDQIGIDGERDLEVRDGSGAPASRLVADRAVEGGTRTQRVVLPGHDLLEVPGGVVVLLQPKQCDASVETRLDEGRVARDERIENDDGLCFTPRQEKCEPLRVLFGLRTLAGANAGERLERTIEVASCEVGSPDAAVGGTGRRLAFRCERGQ